MGFRFQNSLQSKIDQTSKISKSVFISNFPDDCSSRDIWKESLILFGLVVFTYLLPARFESPNASTFQIEKTVPSCLNVGVASWFCRLCNAQSDFAAKERIVWVDIEGTSQTENILESFKLIVKGKVFWARAKELFVWSPSFKDVPEKELFSDDESAKINEQANNLNNDEVENASEVVSDTYFGDNGEVQGFEHQHGESNDKEVSSDPFNIYDLLDKRTKEVRTTDTSTSIPYPPGFTPANDIPACNNQDIPEAESVRPPSRSARSNSRVLEEAENSVDRVSSESFSNGVKIKEGGSILEILEEMITVGQTMGFSMEGLGSKAKKDWIKELISKHKVSFLSIQETKMESVSAMEVKFLWGNYFFDHIISEASGNSGGILCSWDTNFFKKDHHTISDNFIALYGTWIPNNQKLLIISVYAPQSVSSKRMLWSYLESLITSWNGESLIIGDFNELFLSFRLPVWIVTSQTTGLFYLRKFFSDFGPTPFRFYHSWLELLGFDDLVSKSWNSFTLDDSYGLSKDLKSKLCDIDKVLDQGGVTDDILLSRLEVLKQLHDVQSSNNRDIMQKAKIRWAIKGDENSKYFHAIINKKHANLLVKGIMVDGDWIVEPDLVKQEFRRHFTDRFQDPGSRRGSLNFPFPNRLNNDQILELESPISNEDIRTAVWGCGVDKSPGPDGFTFEFFRKYWTVVGPDFCIAVKWFFDHGDFAIGCNSSFVALIPKVLDPKVVSDYRPISLIGSLYKVVTKILASRLSLVISDLISDVQTAFLPNRQILDGPFIINEILARCKLKKQQAMIFKVDFAKAYDSVRWDYLDDVLISFGFGPKWRSWIRGSLSSGKASILVNGSPTTEFHLYRGLKQGDPLAPFLFLLIMESLHLSFSRAVEASEDFLKGYKRPFLLVVFHHLFYAVRPRFIYEESSSWCRYTDNCVAVSCKLYCCLIMKSSVELLGYFSRRIIMFSLRLLGRRTDYKMKKRFVLGGELNPCLSGVVLTLLKSVFGLHSIELHARFSKVPNLFLNYIGESCVGIFLMDQEGDERLLGSNGLRCLLLEFRRVGVSTLHGLIGYVYFCCFQLDMEIIISEVNSFKVKGVDLISHCKIRVGKGTGTSFWKDLWIGDNLLKLSFPRLFALEENKDISVADKMNTSISSSFRRHVRGGVESQQLDQLSLLLDTVILSNMDDRWFWDLNGGRVFFQGHSDVRSMLLKAFLPKMAVPYSMD
ncbi:RNA-directed DNA polymerase, eukaryota [Tanacetum coccineum]